MMSTLLRAIYSAIGVCNAGQLRTGRRKREAEGRNESEGADGMERETTARC